MKSPEFTVIPAITKEQLEKCLSIRLSVFCDEQGFSRDVESDEMDSIASHFLLFPSANSSETSNAIGTARLFAYASDPTIAKIGRVAVLKEGRMKGAGTALMTACELEARKQGGFRVAKLHSQCVAQKFYASCGFVSEGEPFLEGGAPHIMMVKQLQ
ncbi:UNVERIFIED_CONTAM: hypothetical protein HDU68_004192 [Siphonaria sp. JEL0065]|nr:hypothetical protein HDU68_004192 [Siphonaria sp. JEL0065]